MPVAMITAAGDGLLQHHRLQALRGAVDGGGQARRARPGDQHVALAQVAVDAAADGLDDLRPGGLDERVVVVADQHRQPRPVQPGARQQPAARITVGGAEVERHAEPGQQLAQLVRAAVMLAADDPEQVEARLLVLGPVGEELAHQAVQDLLQHPRLHDVVVGLAQRHGLDDGAAHRIVALDQQHPLGQRMHGVRPGQELDSGHLVHVMIHDQQRDGPVRLGQAAQRGEPRCGRCLADDVKVLAEPAGEIGHEGVHDAGVVI
jgi:hypothetical protein